MISISDNMLIRFVLLNSFVAALSACESQPAVIDSTPPVPTYSAAQELRAKQDYKNLPVDSPLRDMLRDCRYTRDQLRVK